MGLGLAPTAIDNFAESATEISSALPVMGNAAICVDSLCTSGRAAVNFYCSPNLLSKALFASSCVCGVMGATTSATALITQYSNIPVVSWLGSFGSRGFNRLGRYTLRMGNVTNGNITNATDIAELMN